MICLRNIHSSKIGPRITPKTIIAGSLAMARSAIAFWAVPPESAIDSRLPMMLPPYMIGRHMSSSVKNRPGVIGNLRVGSSGTAFISIRPIGMAIRYSGPLEMRNCSHIGAFTAFCPIACTSIMDSAMFSATHTASITHAPAPMRPNRQRA